MSPRTLVLGFGGVISRTLFEIHALCERARGADPTAVIRRDALAAVEAAAAAGVRLALPFDLTRPGHGDSRPPHRLAN